jgi:hypothetical protein
MPDKTFDDVGRGGALGGGTAQAPRSSIVFAALTE